MAAAASARRKRRSIGGNLLVFVFLVVMGIFMMLPLVYSVVSSLKPVDELFAFPPRFMVKRPTVDNYAILFSLVSNLWVPFSRYLFNSLFVSIAATLGHIVIASMAAYPLAKFHLKVHWLFQLVVVALLFNTTVLWVPQYFLMSKMNLLNTYLVYILPILPLPLGLFLMKQFMGRVPTAMIESAQIDGAGHFRIFWRVVMPQVKPAWLTLAVFAFQTVWNQQPLNMVFNEDLKLLNMAMSQITAGGMARFGASMAAGVIIMIPPLLVFLFSQSSVVETMSASGIKE